MIHDFAITTEDLNDLRQFMQRIDAVVEKLLEPWDRYGHASLPGYLPWMGARYGFPGYPVPLSVFRGEGMALFLIARAVKPTVVAECFTGTGYSSAFLAAGAPEARVLSVDNYSEGGAGVEGFRVATELRDRLGLENLDLVLGSVSDLNASLGDRVADLYFSDGPYGEAPRLAPSVIHIRQDDANGQVDGRRFAVRGGSYFNVTCPTAEERDALAMELCKAFPVVTV